MRQEYMACEDDTILNVFYLKKQELKHSCSEGYFESPYGCCPIGHEGEKGTTGIPADNEEISFDI